jgi:hypothetical protein
MDGRQHQHVDDLLQGLYMDALHGLLFMDDLLEQ